MAAVRPTILEGNRVPNPRPSRFVPGGEAVKRAGAPANRVNVVNWVLGGEMDLTEFKTLHYDNCFLMM